MFLPGPSASWWSPRWFQGTPPSWPGSRRRWPAWWRPRPSRQRHGYRPGPSARPQIAAGPEPRQRWTGSGRYSTPGPRGPTSTASTPSTPPGAAPGYPRDGPRMAQTAAAGTLLVWWAVDRKKGHPGPSSAFLPVRRQEPGRALPQDLRVVPGCAGGFRLSFAPIRRCHTARRRFPFSSLICIERNQSISQIWPVWSLFFV